MKIRTDFVTNSSSSFTVSIGVNLKSGHKIYMEAFGDNGDFRSANYQLSVERPQNGEIYKNSIHVSDETAVDLMDEESSTYDYDYGIIDLYFSGVYSQECMNIADILASENLKKEIAGTAYFGKINYDKSGKKVTKLCKKYNSMVNEYEETASKYLTTSEDISGMTLYLEFSGWGGDYVDFRTPQTILESIFDHQRAEQITDKIGDDKIASINNLRSLSFLEKFTDSALEAIVNFITECKCYVPGETWVSQELVNDGSVDMTIEWSDEPI